mmetsp:Transcript_21448/g.32821  ORF Transcript_21448/g.32821 Transcript_21448/m.32821 type:complete len:170 (+) Transcript_21448:160-669(+)
MGNHARRLSALDNNAIAMIVVAIIVILCLCIAVLADIYQRGHTNRDIESPDAEKTEEEQIPSVTTEDSSEEPDEEEDKNEEEDKDVEEDREVEEDKDLEEGLDIVDVHACTSATCPVCCSNVKRTGFFDIPIEKKGTLPPKVLTSLPNRWWELDNFEGEIPSPKEACIE